MDHTTRSSSLLSPNTKVPSNLSGRLSSTSASANWHDLPPIPHFVYFRVILGVRGISGLKYVILPFLLVSVLQFGEE